MVYFHPILLAHTVLHYLDTGMQAEDNVLPSTSVAGHGVLAKMCIALEPHGILCLKFASLYILMLSGHWYAKRRRCFADH